MGKEKEKRKVLQKDKRVLPTEMEGGVGSQNVRAVTYIRSCARLHTRMYHSRNRMS